MPAASAATHRFTKALARALRQKCRVGLVGVRREPARILVAVSGGSDSVALLRSLHALSHRRGWKLDLTVAHVQHHLRPGKDAEGDAGFVAELAEQLHLPYLRRDLDSAGRRGNLEAWARRQRYAALRDMAREARCNYIATAHHGDDQLETILMRLLRGASVRGLSAMAWRQRFARDTNTPPLPGMTLIRPMLAVDHAAVIEFLAHLKQPWREDHTNTDLTRTRARLRHDVLPTLRALRPDAARRAVALADDMRSVRRAVEHAITVASPIVQRDADAVMLNRADARRLPVSVLTGLLRRLLVDQGVPADSLSAHVLNALTRAVHDATGGRRVFSFQGGCKLSVTRTQVTITLAKP